jgi:kynurenine formamidase
MKKLICGLLVLGAFGLGSLWAADGFAGTWKLNVAKSKFAKGHELKDETVVIAEQGDNRVVTVKGTDGAGKPISAKYTTPVGGGTQNYTEGAPAAGAGAIVVSKRVDANTIDSTSTLNGKQVRTTHTVLSADGKTITQTVNYLDGNALKGVLVLDRQ